MPKTRGSKDGGPSLLELQGMSLCATSRIIGNSKPKIREKLSTLHPTRATVLANTTKICNGLRSVGYFFLARALGVTKITSIPAEKRPETLTDRYYELRRKYNL